MFEKQKLTADRIEDYVLGANPHFFYIKNYETKTIENVESLKQRDFGDELDCTLTSLTTCINHFLNYNIFVGEIYLEVEKNALKYFYNGKIWGTFPIFIKSIYDKSLKYFGINKKTNRRYLKNIGFNYNTIKKIIDKDIPVILSIYDDGREYYKNHTITIVGYTIITLSNNKKVYLLNCYDNWSSEIAFVDYKVMSTIAAINFLTL